MIRATFAFPSFEDKERLQTHCNGIEIWLRGTISIKSARERSPVRKQIRIPSQPAWPKGYKHTAMALRFSYVVRSLSRAQERDRPCGNKSECHRGTPVLFAGQIPLEKNHLLFWNLCYSFHFRRLRTFIWDSYWNGLYVHGHMLYYTDTCYILTGCFPNS